LGGLCCWAIEEFTGWGVFAVGVSGGATVIP
jgi:hypothetical protein